MQNERTIYLPIKYRLTQTMPSGFITPKVQKNVKSAKLLQKSWTVAPHLKILLQHSTPPVSHNGEQFWKAEFPNMAGNL